MKLALLAGLALLAVACGPSDAVDVDARSGAALPADPQVTTSTTLAPAVVQPDHRNASPEPIAEPLFKPVPEPVPDPAPKPARPSAPTPPSPRQEPVAPGLEPVLPPADRPIPRDDHRVAAAISDLAARLNQDAAEIELLDARDVTWRDGSVGCPTPGLAYSQALVPGFLIVLQSGDASYVYHAAGDLLPFFCESPQAPLEGNA